MTKPPAKGLRLPDGWIAEHALDRDDRLCLPEGQASGFALGRRIPKEQCTRPHRFDTLSKLDILRCGQYTNRLPSFLRICTWTALPWFYAGSSITTARGWCPWQSLGLTRAKSRGLTQTWICSSF